MFSHHSNIALKRSLCVVFLWLQLRTFLSDPRLTIALPCNCESLSKSLSALVEFCSNWFCQSCCMDSFKSCYMDPSKSKNGFLCVVTWISQIDTWISISCNVDLSKLKHGFVKVVTWICHTCSMYFSPFAKQNKAEV